MRRTGDDVGAVVLHELIPCYQIIPAGIPKRYCNPCTVSQHRVLQVAVKDTFNLIGAFPFVGITPELSDRTLERSHVAINAFNGSLH